MYSGQDHQIDTDIAIIGGGTAGLNTAMAAAESGLQVLVVDKANINRSGAIAGGIDHFMAFLETGEDWDTREAWLKYVGGLAKGAANLKIHEAVYCEEVNAGIERVERIGIPLRDPGTEAHPGMVVRRYPTSGPIHSIERFSRIGAATRRKYPRRPA